LKILKFNKKFIKIKKCKKSRDDRKAANSRAPYQFHISDCFPLQALSKLLSTALADNRLSLEVVSLQA
jgi:hypothetical protein